MFKKGPASVSGDYPEGAGGQAFVQNLLEMAQANVCWGHREREDRRNKINRIAAKPKENPDENYRVLIKKGPVSVETSLKDLEDNYKSKPEWKVIEDGGVLSIPVEELRMENPPRPDRSGQVVFKEKRGRGGNQIESYPVGQTIENLNELIRSKHEEEKEKGKAAGKSESDAEKKAFAVATKLPQYTAVKHWQDTMAEIKLKRALKKMMVALKSPPL